MSGEKHKHKDKSKRREYGEVEREAKKVKKHSNNDADVQPIRS